MGLEIILNTCHLSSQFEDSTNPFTGETIQVPVGESISPEERDALMEYISANGQGPDEMGFCHFDLGEQGAVELHLNGIDDEELDLQSGSFTLRSTGPEISALLFNIIDIGGFIALVVTSPSLMLTTRNEYAQEVQSRWPDVLVVKDAVALHAALRGPFETWQTYRDQVLEELD